MYIKYGGLTHKLTARLSSVPVIQRTSHHWVRTKISFLALLIIFLYLSLPFIIVFDFNLHINSFKTLYIICHCSLSSSFVSDSLLPSSRSLRSLSRNFIRSRAVLMCFICWIHNNPEWFEVLFCFFFSFSSFWETDEVDNNGGGKMKEDTGSANKIKIYKNHFV